MFDSQTPDSIEITHAHQITQLDMLRNILRKPVMSPRDATEVQVIDAVIMMAQHDTEVTSITKEDIYDEVIGQRTRPVTQEEDNLLKAAWKHVSSRLGY
jgi:hypothetical protein